MRIGITIELSFKKIKAGKAVGICSPHALCGSGICGKGSCKSFPSSSLGPLPPCTMASSAPAGPVCRGKSPCCSSLVA